MSQAAPLDIIGSNVLVSVGATSDIPAKIDTGADSSAIWVSDVKMSKSGTLTFKLFAPGYPLYTGRIVRTREYDALRIRSSSGHSQVRYRVKLPTIINGRKINIRYTLANRSRNRFPILIGRSTVKNRFLIDVRLQDIPHTCPHARPRPRKLATELSNDPHKFHQTYIKTQQEKPL